MTAQHQPLAALQGVLEDALYRDSLCPAPKPSVHCRVWLQPAANMINLLLRPASEQGRQCFAK